jgi:hypothetical protein
MASTQAPLLMPQPQQQNMNQPQPPNVYMPPQPVTSAVQSAAQQLFDGNVIVLHSRSSNRCLRSHPNAVIDGNGTVMEQGSKWIVRAVGNHVRLQNAKYQQQVLRVSQNGVDANGGLGPLTLFNVIAHMNGDISLASVQFPGQHVGFLPSGHAKSPSQTGTGKHARFLVTQAQVNPQVYKTTGVTTGYGTCPMGGYHTVRNEYTCCCLCMPNKRCVSCGQLLI